MPVDTKETWTAWEKAPLNPSIASMLREKTRGHTIFREGLVKNTRYNAVHTRWGAEIARRIMDVADYWASKTDTELLDLVPIGNPRAVTPGQYFGDPISGGNRETFVTCLETPYRWYNPKTKVWWYDGALVKNPGTGKDVKVKDDGSGFVSPEGFARPGERTMFVAAYRLFIIGMLLGQPYAQAAGPNVIPESTGKRYAGAVPHLAEAYALSGDLRYAEKAAILLGRLAELYPYMNGTRGDGTSAEGMHWAEVSTTEYQWLQNLFDAADLIYDAIDANLENALAEVFIHTLDPECKPRTTPFDFKKSINEMAFFAAQTAETGRHTNSDQKLWWIRMEMALAAFCESPELMDHLLFHGPHCLRTTLENGFYRDGRYHYDSTAYLRGINEVFLSIPLRAVGFTGGEKFVTPLNLYTDPRFPIGSIVSLICEMDTGALEASFGDTGPPRNPKSISEERISGFPRYNPDMEVAAALMPDFRRFYKIQLGNRSTEDLKELRAKGDFTTLAFVLPEQAVIEQTSSTPLSCSLLEDSPTSFLRCGRSHRTRHDLVLWGQPTAPHAHGDKLGIWFGGRGRHLAASGGGYPFTWVSPKTMAWETHSAACWVVLIDGKNQASSHSHLLAQYEGELFSLSSMENLKAYPTSNYQRTVWLVPGPIDSDAYVLDIFRVSNGTVFDYNTRGIDAGTFDDLVFDFGELKPQWESRKGTLAGENIGLYTADGYGWMKDVRQTSTDRDFSWMYNYRGAALKVHALSFGQKRTVICALGELGGYETGKAPWDPHVLWRDEGSDAASHEAQFVTVLESVGEKPFLQNIRSLVCDEMGSGFHPVGITILHESGEKDVILACNGIGQRVRFTDPKGGVWTTDAFAAMQRIGPTGKVLCTEIFDGTILQTPNGTYHCAGAYEGRIEPVDYINRRITVLLDSPARDEVCDESGRIAIISPSGGGRPSPYRVQSAELSDRHLTFTSNISLIHVDTRFPTPKEAAIRLRQIRTIDGRDVIVDVVEGDHFRLPMSTIYRY